MASRRIIFDPKDVITLQLT